MAIAPHPLGQKNDRPRPTDAPTSVRVRSTDRHSKPDVRRIWAQPKKSRSKNFASLRLYSIAREMQRVTASYIEDFCVYWALILRVIGQVYISCPTFQGWQDERLGQECLSLVGRKRIKLTRAC